MPGRFLLDGPDVSRWKRWKSFGSSSGWMPGPRFSIATSTSASRRESVTRVGALGSPYLAALRRRFPTTWSTRAASAWTSGTPSSAASTTARSGRSMLARSTAARSWAQRSIGCRSREKRRASSLEASSRSSAIRSMRWTLARIFRLQPRMSAASDRRDSMPAHAVIAVSGCLRSCATMESHSSRSRSRSMKWVTSS
ncbi:hypothetical protein BE18_40660 [Sorangium cellulosum]|uniref:Uncharacterized protein n=1 Tax=Sorangium cellulosum TaxID=56 RepID=A0A150S6G6_SORCE|nr:hypothetical protein BE18_40660 [Sorangium cellulosum]